MNDKFPVIPVHMVRWAFMPCNTSYLIKYSTDFFSEGGGGFESVESACRLLGYWMSQEQQFVCATFLLKIPRAAVLKVSHHSRLLVGESTEGSPLIINFQVQEELLTAK